MSHRTIIVSIFAIAIVLTALFTLAAITGARLSPPKVNIGYSITFTAVNGTRYNYTSLSLSPLSLWTINPLAITINNIVFNTITISWLATFNIQPTTGYGWLSFGRGNPSNSITNPVKTYTYPIAVDYIINTTLATNGFCAANQPSLPAGTCYFIQPPTTAYNTSAVAITSGVQATIYSETYTQAQILQWFTDANNPTLTAGAGYQICARMNPQLTNTPNGVIAYANTINSGAGASAFTISSVQTTNIYCINLRYTGTSPTASIVILGITLGGASSTT